MVYHVYIKLDERCNQFNGYLVFCGGCHVSHHLHGVGQGRGTPIWSCTALSREADEIISDAIMSDQTQHYDIKRLPPAFERSPPSHFDFDRVYPACDRLIPTIDICMSGGYTVTVCHAFLPQCPSNNKSFWYFTSFCLFCLKSYSCVLQC